jgi:hypothetical protein
MGKVGELFVIGLRMGKILNPPKTPTKKKEKQIPTPL